MPDTPKPPPPEPPANEPGPPPEKRAAMRHAVQDVMRKVQADQEAKAAEILATRARAGRRHTRGIAMVAVAAIALALALNWALPRWQHPFVERSGPEADRDARVAILFLAKVIDSWEAQHHRLPATLHEAGIELPAVSYASAGDHYELRARAGNREVLFISTENRDAFAAGR